MGLLSFETVHCAAAGNPALCNSNNAGGNFAELQVGQKKTNAALAWGKCEAKSFHATKFLGLVNF